MEHSIRHDFGEEHAQMERGLERLRDAVEGADRTNLVKEWSRFERQLTAHLEAEEEHLFPALEGDFAEGVTKARADHADIRRRLDELGVEVELHTVRLETVDGFLAALRAHKDAEDAGLYRAADERLEAPARARAIARAS